MMDRAGQGMVGHVVRDRVRQDIVWQSRAWKEKTGKCRVRLGRHVYEYNCHDDSSLDND